MGLIIHYVAKDPSTWDDDVPLSGRLILMNIKQLFMNTTTRCLRAPHGKVFPKLFLGAIFNTTITNIFPCAMLQKS